MTQGVRSVNRASLLRGACCDQWQSVVCLCENVDNLFKVGKETVSRLISLTVIHSPLNPDKANELSSGYPDYDRCKDKNPGKAAFFD